MSRRTSVTKRSTREAILDAATQLFMQQAAAHIGEVTLEDIAQAAGVSRQSVYIHFRSRSQLLIAMVRHIDEKAAGISEHIRALAQAPSALAALDIAIPAPGGYYPTVYSIARLFLAGKYADGALKAAWDDRMEARRGIADLLVRRLKAEGALSPEWDVRTASGVLWVLTSWQVWEQLVIDRGWSKKRYTDFLRKTIRHTLIAPRSRARQTERRERSRGAHPTA